MIKMNPVDVKSSTYINCSKEINDEDLKLVISLEYQNTKTILQKAMFQIGLKKFLWLKKLKTLCRGHYVAGDLKGEEIL